MGESGVSQQSLPAVTQEVINEEQQQLDRDQTAAITFKQRVSGILRGWVFKEAYTLIKLTVPVTLALIFQQLLLFVSTLCVGHISGRSLELDSAALATSYINLTGFSIGIGLSTAADTLCSQSYGSKNYKRVGHIFQRGVLILLVLVLFTWCLWLNTESVLLLLQQPPCVARLTSVYVQIYCLGLPPLFLYIMLQKYLQAQSLVWPFILIGIAANVINAALHGALIFGAGLGVPGAAISMVISLYSLPILLILYVWARKLHKQTWDGWSWESLRDWWQFLKLGLPGIAMICVEWISYEISAFVLGSIDQVQLGINAVIISILSMLAMAPVGLSISVTIRVGNELGAGEPQRAKRAAYIGLFMAMANAVMTIIFLQSVRTVIGNIFTNDQEILDKIPLMIHIVSFAIFFDQTQFLIAGVLRGQGRQFLGAAINAFSYYVFGLPIGISLALAAEMGTVGMWIGLDIASFIQAVCFGIILLLTNWEHQAKKAVEQSKEKEDQKEAELESTSSISSDDISDQLIMRETVLLSQDESKKEDERDKVSLDSLEYIEEVPLVDDEAFLVEESAVVVKKRAALVCCQYPKTKVGLLLCRGSLFVLGAALVIGAGVSSQYHPPVINGNYSECSANDTDDDYTTVAIQPSTSSINLTVSPTTTLSYSLDIKSELTSLHSVGASVFHYVVPTPT